MFPSACVSQGFGRPCGTDVGSMWLASLPCRCVAYGMKGRLVTFAMQFSMKSTVVSASWRTLAVPAGDTRLDGLRVGSLWPWPLRVFAVCLPCGVRSCPLLVRRQCCEACSSQCLAPFGSISVGLRMAWPRQTFCSQLLCDSSDGSMPLLCSSI